MNTKSWVNTYWERNEHDPEELGDKEEENKNMRPHLSWEIQNEHCTNDIRKHATKRCTFKQVRAGEINTNRDPPFNSTRYAEIDHWLRTRKAKHIIESVETSVEANIDSDLLPSVVTVKDEFKIQTQNENRSSAINESHKTESETKLKEHLMENNDT